MLENIVTAPGKFELMATLSPVERRSDSGGRSFASSGRRAGHGHDRKNLVHAAPAEVPRTAPPVMQPRETMPPSALPPLGERNPVKRLGR